jgi:lipoprotein-anchoring transpeptidase ErfK/SrfK
MLLLGAALGGCHAEGSAAPPGASGSAGASSPASSSAPARPGAGDAAARAAPGSAPLLGIRGFAVTVFTEPRATARKLGYLRVGTLLERSEAPVGKGGECDDEWYAVKPRGFVCAGHEATTDLDDPVLRAASHGADRAKPLPYRYGFVRSVAPLYTRVPSSAQQYKAEMDLDKHLAWYKENKAEVQTTGLGADDVAVDARGLAVPGKRLGELGTRKNSTELSYGELFGGTSDDDPMPFWLRDNERLIPNVSEFAVPEYATFADRARRHTGLAFLASFKTGPESLGRRFAVTTDLRLAPTSKVKPDSGSAFHGVVPGRDVKMPFVFVRRRGAQLYQIQGDTASPVGEAEYRSVHALSGKQQLAGSAKYYQLDDGRWLDAEQSSLVLQPAEWPKVAKAGQKWVEVDLSEQVLVAWEGTKPVFATLVSTGRPPIGDPETTTATPRGVFHLMSKHLTITMDSDEGRTRKVVEEKGLKPGDPGYVPSKGDGVYGVSKRRGEGLFKLRDVPYVQYFEKNYAIHGAYWHDVFGIARSHGCINLSPVDAHFLFGWTDPPLPEGWHGVNVDEGTTVIVHK